MNQLAIHKVPGTPYFADQRKNQRHEVLNLLAVTERGTGQILDINLEGLSFGCLYPHTFPHEFSLDILDAKGSHIKRLNVRKIRETNENYDQGDAGFELVIGVEFYQLAVSQLNELCNLLNNNMEELPGYTHFA